MIRSFSRLFVLLAALLPSGGYAQAATVVSTQDFHIAYPGACANRAALAAHDAEHGPAGAAGSTHEITPEITASGKPGNALWITGQNYDSVARITTGGNVQVHHLPRRDRVTCLGPHGIEFDRSGKLWVTFEFAGEIAQLDAAGNIAKTFDVRYYCADCAGASRSNPRFWINPHPHGMTVAHDGKTIWYTGKATGSIGKITLASGKMETFALPTLGGVPIYIKEDPRGVMWVTELVGNKIARITPSGGVAEFTIPTPNSRPIAIVPGPDGKAMWFSEEAGSKIGRIDPNGSITEFDVPVPVPSVGARYVLAGLAFDGNGNLWVQQYADPNGPSAGPVTSPCSTICDYVVEIDKAILTAPSGTQLTLNRYLVPTQGTVMHRIIKGPDGNMWYTELKTNNAGKVTFRPGKARAAH